MCLVRTEAELLGGGNCSGLCLTQVPLIVIYTLLLVSAWAYYVSTLVATVGRLLKRNPCKLLSSQAFVL